MSQTTINAAVQRFEENENRVDIFVNQNGFYSTNTNPVKNIETLPSFIARMIQRYITLNFKGTWLTSTPYQVNELVKESSTVYICVVDHTSGTFATDLSAEKWAVYQGVTSSDLSSLEDGYGVDLVARAKKTLFEVDDLDTCSPLINSHVYVRCFETLFDKGLGEFEWNSASVATPVRGLVHKVTDIETGRWLRHASGNVMPEAVGAFGNSSTACHVALQKYADYCGTANQPFFITGGVPGTAGDFVITSPITFSKPVSVIGVGHQQGKILALGCDGLKWTGTGTNRAWQMKVDNIIIAQGERHSSVANSYVGIKLEGSTDSRPYWNEFNNIYLDGFGVGFHVNWAWEQKWTKCTTGGGGVSILGQGICVNNRVSLCSFNDIGNSITIGDGTNTIEGWQILGNFFNGCERAVLAKGAAGCQFCNNLVDHFRTTALYATSGTGLPTFGWKINDNYLAATGGVSLAASEGVWINNLVASAANTGNQITGNEIFAYSGSALGTGLLLTGAGQVKDNVSRNKILATIDVSSESAYSMFRDNEWMGGGFYTTVLADYDGNTGPIGSSKALLFKTSTRGREFYGAGIPADGLYYYIGDRVVNIVPTVDANQMVLTGWLRLTNGSSNVLGTDWANMYVSHTSPAN